MSKLAIIGGSGISQLEAMENVETLSLETTYGEASVFSGQLAGCDLIFMPRHGEGHSIPPHKINYRANIAGLQQLGVSRIVACNAVGGIHSAMGPGKLVLPDQIIDYTYGREHTFSDCGHVDHVDFSYPYDMALRDLLLRSLKGLGLDFVDFGVYGCTQGPRLETAAEIRRLQRDGCDLVGMTAMPEAALAREAGIDYASICLVANWGAGLTEELISMDEILAVIAGGVEQINRLLLDFVPAATN